MLGLEGYGSDDSDSGLSPPSSHSRATSTALSSQESTLSLPPPAKLPAKLPAKPLKTKTKRTVFTIAKPSKTAGSDGDEDNLERPAKKPRLDARTGAGSSSLLAMLPAPSKIAPARTAPPKVLGSASQGAGAGISMASSIDESSHADDSTAFTEDSVNVADKSTLLLPPSLGRGKHKTPEINKVATSKPLILENDFFSLGASSSSATPATSAPDEGLSSSSLAITSAPTIPTFEIPDPTPSDPYPGYYQLPSGQWVAYEPEFYRKHYEAWTTSARLDGASQKGFEGAEGDGTVEVDGQEQLDLARKEREEKKALTKDANGGRTAPKMNIKAPKIGSRARTRHQLSALLTEAYENREALEEKIAQGRRNRKEAGNKYGF